MERGSVHSPPLAQLWRPTKFFISCLRVSGSQLSELLLSCARHGVDWENLGVPYLVKSENPPLKTCAAHLHLHSEGRQMFGCACVGLYVLAVFCVCSLSVYLGSVLFVTAVLLFFHGRCGCRSSFFSFLTTCLPCFSLSCVRLVCAVRGSCIAFLEL